MFVRFDRDPAPEISACRLSLALIFLALGIVVDLANLHDWNYFTAVSH